MKVVYICPTVGMYGDNIALLKIIPYLELHGVQPYFILLSDGPMSRKLKERGYEYKIFQLSVYYANYYVKVDSFRAFVGFWKKKIFKNRKTYSELLYYVKGLSPDLIHSNNSFTQIGYNISKDLNINHVWHIREYGLLDTGRNYFPSIGSFLKKINSKKNYSICITSHIYEYFKSSPMACVIYDGIFDTDPPQIYEEDSNYFLFVGRITDKKGVEDVVNSYIEYKNKTSDNIIELWISGEGSASYIRRLNSIIESRNMQGQIRFLGYRDDVYDLMKKAKALIVASRFEAFGLITAESMFNGCPVIGKNIGGTKIQFDNGLNYSGSEIGFRYQKNEELVNQLEYISNTPKIELLPLLKRAQDTVNGLYSANNSAKYVYNFYSDIMHSIKK